MTSFVETTAFSLRKGNTVSNLEFTGVMGELVFDQGYEQNGTLGTDVNATLRVHNGINKGGIPMCRADTRNISTKVLAENRGLFDDKNLAYADLSNLEVTEDNAATTTIVTTLNNYGLATKTDLNEATSILALKDMSNVLTSSLASGRGDGVNGNLAYADTSNVNTADLASAELHNGNNGNKPLSYYDFSNVNTTNLTLNTSTRPSGISGPVLATSTLNNVAKEDLQTVLFNPDNELNLEVTTNKDYVIPQTGDEVIYGHYPTTAAVKKYVSDEIEAGGFLTVDLKNIKSYDPLYANSTTLYKYSTDTKNIINAGTGFEVNQLYYAGRTLEEKQYLSIVVDEIVQNKITVDNVYFRVPFGTTDFGEGCIIKAQALSDTAQVLNTLTVTFNSEPFQGIYKYVVTAVSTQTGWANGFEDDTSYDIIPELVTNKVEHIKITGVAASGAISSFEIKPNLVEAAVDREVTITPNGEGTNAVINFVSENIIPAIGPGKLLKTDFTNLPGMLDPDKSIAEDVPWRINNNIAIPNVQEPSIDESVFCLLTNNGQVWRALNQTKDWIFQQGGVPDWKANTSYNTTPNISKVFHNGILYYCKTPHTSTGTFDASKWTIIDSSYFEALKNKNSNLSLDTTSTIKYPNNKAVADYVQQQIEKAHQPGHYYGQVDIFVLQEENLPGNASPSAEYTITPTEGLQAVIENYNDTNEPAIATYTSGAWTYEKIAIQNGIYVYVLNLGKTYYNGPGNVTWNTATNRFDIAPDKFQVPDGTTLNLNSSTGAIQIVPALQTKLGYVDVTSSISGLLATVNNRLAALERTTAGMIIPNPQFFTGTNTVNQNIVISDNVAFDLYINGVFQYPNTYTYTAATKTIVIPFAVEDTTTNGIAVIYRGFRKV